MKLSPLKVWVVVAAVGGFCAGMGLANWWHAEPPVPMPPPASRVAAVRDPEPRGDLPPIEQATQIAAEFFRVNGPASGRSIGAVWLDVRGPVKIWVADIWPPYEVNQPARGPGERLGIQVGASGEADWTWLRGTQLVTDHVTHAPPEAGAQASGASPASPASPADGRRRIILPADVPFTMGPDGKKRLLLPPPRSTE